MTGTTCIECGGKAALVNGDKIYPHRPDLYHKSFWLCECGAYCGCHKGTEAPLGRPCGANTRKARMAAHDAFDAIWKTGRMSRSKAYKWLSGELGIDRKLCHIGMMSKDDAMKVISICEETEKAA